MSLTLCIAAGARSQDWTVSAPLLEDLNALEAKADQQALNTLLGPDDLPFGGQWIVSRPALEHALQRLMASAAKATGGFQMRYQFPGAGEVVGAGGASGISIGGRFHIIECRDFCWQMAEVKRRKPIWGPNRYDVAEIATDNFGVIRIERRKAGRRSVVRMLDEVLAFVHNSQSNAFTLTLG